MSTPSDRIQRVGNGTQFDAVIVYLSGPLRGRSVPIAGPTLHFAKLSGALLTPGEVGDSPPTGTLSRAGARYELVVSKHQAVWVNGEPVNARLLESGDLIEIGDGPVLCFRLYPSGASPLRGSKGILAECANAAPRRTMPLWTRALRLVRTMPHALVARAWRRSRWSVLIGLASLVGALSYLSLQTHDLEKQLMRDQNRVSGLADMLGKLEGQALTRNELSTLPDGRPLTTLDGSGPLVEVRFSGTAFVAAEDGVLLTNRHVALPWEGEASLPAIRAAGLEPVMHRMKGYLPGPSNPSTSSFWERATPTTLRFCKAMVRRAR